MNIAVINIKDILKLLIKVGIVVLGIYLCFQLLNLLNNTRQDSIKENIEGSVETIKSYTFLDCLDVSMSLFSYKNVDKNKSKNISNQDILAMESGIFNESIFENTDLVIDTEKLTIDDTEELTSQVQEIGDNVTTEEVTENNITAKYTTSYNTVKINNQSKYDITGDMLVPDAEITNKEDILIYHTHTCESYTQSERI